MSITFADVSEAFTARMLPVLLYVRIGGVSIDATEARCNHSVNRPVGTCTIFCAAPRPASAVLNADIEIEMGYPGATRRTFYGFIPSDDSVTDDSGHMVRIDGVGWCSRLRDPEFAGIEVQGPVQLKEVFRSLMALREIPNYLSDDTTATDGITPIVLGGNTAITNGHIRLDNDTAPLDWLDSVPDLFGYRVFDSPDGTIRMARVSGLARPQLSDPVQTTDLADGDYIQPTTLTNFREGPGTSYATIDQVDEGDIGRVISDEQVTAEGFVWMQMTFPGLPAGWCALSASGIPRFYKLTPDAVPARYEEGVNVFRIGRSRDLDPMANYIEVLGARYTAEDGGTTAIRAIPDEVLYSDYLAPKGWRQYTVSSQDITTDQQAQWVRTATEVDRAAPYEEVTFDSWGKPDLQPGDVITVHAPTHDSTVEDYWVTDLDQWVDSRGYQMSVTAWRGAGQALKAGNDCRTETLTTDVIHAGTQTISWYRDPSPDSVRDPYETEKDRSDRRWVVLVPFTVTSDNYSSLRLNGICHGTNSINNKTTIDGSQIEIWQLEDPSAAENGTNERKRVGSIALPTANEELSKRRNYASTDQHWTQFRLPFPGTLMLGGATLVVVCGESDDGEVDDFELAELSLTYCGVGVPTLPGAVT